MFTGIVEEIGTVRSLTKSPSGVRIVIGADRVLSDIQTGDSIAVNGVCLTATEFGKDFFCADVMRESLSRSSLKDLRQSDRVNLERAMSMGKRFGGHIVTGHIDAVGTISGTRNDGISTVYSIRADNQVMRYTVMKGSVAIDGISLTVSSVSDAGFEVSVIPHTIKNTILSAKGEGDAVNIEADIIGKHVENLLRFSSGDSKNQRAESSISSQFLSENGFL